MEENRGHIALGQADKAHLTKAAKWAKFIAIAQFVAIGTGIVGCIFMILAGMVAGASMDEIAEFPGMEGAVANWSVGFMMWYGIVMIAVMAVGIFVALYLFHFARKTLNAIRLGDDGMMTEAFANLGRYFKLSGIVIIISLALTILACIGAIIFAAVTASAAGAITY